MNQKFNMIRQMLAAFVLFAGILGLSSCEKYTFIPPVADPDATYYFQADIQPIFTANCISCHDGTPVVDLRDGTSYAALTKGKFITAPALTSKLYSKLTEGSHSTRATDAEKAKILKWINDGALNN
jgi:hypothetical protein